MASIPNPTYCKSGAVSPDINNLPLVNLTAEAAMRKSSLINPFVVENGHPRKHEEVGKPPAGAFHGYGQNLSKYRGGSLPIYQHRT